MGLAPEEAVEPKRPDIVIALLPQSALSDAGVERRCRPLLGRFPRLSVKGPDLMDTLILREDARVQGDLLALVMDDIVSLAMSVVSHSLNVFTPKCVRLKSAFASFRNALLKVRSRRMWPKLLRGGSARHQ